MEERLFSKTDLRSGDISIVEATDGSQGAICSVQILPKPMINGLLL